MAFGIVLSSNGVLVFSLSILVGFCIVIIRGHCQLEIFFSFQYEFHLFRNLRNESFSCGRDLSITSCKPVVRSDEELEQNSAGLNALLGKYIYFRNSSFQLNTIRRY